MGWRQVLTAIVAASALGAPALAAQAHAAAAPHGGRLTAYVTMRGLGAVASPPAVTTVAMASARVGFSGGDGVLLATRDGGAHWRRVWRGPGAVNQILALSATDAVAVTSDGALATTDGGRTWSPLNEPGGHGPCTAGTVTPCWVNASFASARVGYAVATLPQSVGTSTSWTAISPDGRVLYVANTSGTVSAYGLRAHRLLWYVQTGQAPTAVAVSLDGRFVYVTNQNGNTLGVVDSRRHALVATVPVGPYPCAVAVSPDGRRVYVTSSGSGGGTVVVDARSRRVVGRLAAGGSCAIALSPHGKRLFVSASGGGVAVVATATDRVVATLLSGVNLGGLNGLGVSPDGRRLYVSDSMANRILVVDTGTGRTLARWRTPPLPYAVAVDPRHARLWVTGNGFVAALGLSNGRIVSVLAADGADFGGFALAPGGGRVYVADGTGVLATNASRGQTRLLATSGVATYAGFGTPVPLQGGTLWRTSDGGRTWRALKPPAAVQTVCASSATVVYAAAQGVVYESTDGGARWQASLRAPLSNGSGAAIPLLACAGASVVAGFGANGAAMGHSPYAMFVSSDHGRRWRLAIEENYTHMTRTGVNAPEGPGSYPGPFTLTPAGVPVFAGSVPAAGAAALMVAPSGPGPVSRTVSGVQAISALSFVSPRHGWAVTAGSGGGRIVATTDGGRTWRQVYPKVDGPVDAVAFVGAQRGFGLGVPGNARAVVATADGGRTWHTVGDLPAPAPPYPGGSLAFANARAGAAIDAMGRLYTTDDGGRTWQDTGRTATAVAFDGEVGCALPQGTGKVSLTTNGGRTWHAGASVTAGATALACAAVAAHPQLRATLAGWNGQASLIGVGPARVLWLASAIDGVFYRSLNGGGTWTELTPAPAAGPDALNAQPAFVSGQVGYLLNSRGALYRTQDGGARWAAVS